MTTPRDDGNVSVEDLQAENAALRPEVERLNARIAELEHQLRKGSQSSSLPPSLDRPRKRRRRGRAVLSDAPSSAGQGRRLGLVGSSLVLLGSMWRGGWILSRSWFTTSGAVRCVGRIEAALHPSGSRFARSSTCLPEADLHRASRRAQALSMRSSDDGPFPLRGESTDVFRATCAGDGAVLVACPAPAG